MIKADAYGHGLVAVARALDEADAFAVARLQEALTLRSAAVTKRIVLMGTLLDATGLRICSQQHVDVTAHDETSVSLIASRAQHTPLRVWLKLDSGMHRLGLSPDDFVAAARLITKLPGITEVVHMTHFSCAAQSSTIVTDRQIAVFQACHRAGSPALASLANSAAIIARPETHADWVRPGIMLYGHNPMGGRYPLPLREAMTLYARIIALREIAAGEAVGYDARWRSERPSRIATVGIGYGDGYPRHARGGTPVCVNGGLAPLVGQVSMDSLAIDITDCRDAKVGDEVTLWGPELPAATIADYAGTIPYELFTSLQPRVSREYEVPCHHSHFGRINSAQPSTRPSPNNAERRR